MQRYRRGKTWIHCIVAAGLNEKEHVTTDIQNHWIYSIVNVQKDDNVSSLQNVENQLYDLIQTKTQNIEFWNTDDLNMGEASACICKELDAYSKRHSLSTLNVQLVYPFPYSDSVSNIQMYVDDTQAFNTLLLKCVWRLSTSTNLV